MPRGLNFLRGVPRCYRWRWLHNRGVLAQCTEKQGKPQLRLRRVASARNLPRNDLLM